MGYIHGRPRLVYPAKASIRGSHLLRHRHAIDYPLPDFPQGIQVDLPTGAGGQPELGLCYDALARESLMKTVTKERVRVNRAPEWPW